MTFRSFKNLKAAWVAWTQVILISGSACKPVKLAREKSEQTKAVADCSFGSCLKPGNVVALIDGLSASANPESRTEPLKVTVPGISKGDLVYVFARVSYPKGTAGTKATLQFKNGSDNAGHPTTQFVGDDAVGNTVARLSTQFAATAAGSPDLSLRSSVSLLPDAKATNGGVLVFRSLSIQDAFSPKYQDKVFFAVDFPDFDELTSKSVAPGSSSTKVMSGTIKAGAASDILLVRGGTSWEISPGKRNACEGGTITWHLSADDAVIATEGPFALNSSKPIGFASFEAVHKAAGKTVSKIELRASITPGGAADKNSCTVDIGEPTTLSAIVFRRASGLGSTMLSARFLQEMGTSTQKPGRFASNSSNPPIESLTQFSWSHIQNDVLVTDLNLVLGAEDRVQASKVLIQMNRAPDGLSSSVAKSMIMSPDRPAGFFIGDVASDSSTNPLTKFFVTGMAVNADAKPIAVLESRIVFMHFRELGARP